MKATSQSLIRADRMIKYYYILAGTIAVSLLCAFLLNSSSLLGQSQKEGRKSIKLELIVPEEEEVPVDLTVDSEPAPIQTKSEDKSNEIPSTEEQDSVKWTPTQRQEKPSSALTNKAKNTQTSAHKARVVISGAAIRQNNYSSPEIETSAGNTLSEMEPQLLESQKEEALETDSSQTPELALPDLSDESAPKTANSNVDLQASQDSAANNTSNESDPRESTNLQATLKMRLQSLTSDENETVSESNGWSPRSGRPLPAAPVVINDEEESGDKAKQANQSSHAIDSYSDSTPEPKTELKTEPSSEPKPELNSEPSIEPKTELNPELKPELNSEPSLEPKTELNPEPKPELNPEPSIDTNPEPKTEPSIEPKPEPKTEPSIEPKPELNSEPSIDTNSELNPEPKTEPKPELNSEPSIDTSLEPKTEPNSDSNNSNQPELTGPVLAGSSDSTIPVPQSSETSPSISLESPEIELADPENSIQPEGKNANSSPEQAQSSTENNSNSEESVESDNEPEFSKIELSFSDPEIIDIPEVKVKTPEKKSFVISGKKNALSNEPETLSSANAGAQDMLPIQSIAVDSCRGVMMTTTTVPKEIFVTDENICVCLHKTGCQTLLIGRRPGTTLVTFNFGKAEYAPVIYRVTVNSTEQAASMSDLLDAMQKLVQIQYPDASIRLTIIGQRLIVQGKSNPSQSNEILTFLRKQLNVFAPQFGANPSFGIISMLPKSELPNSEANAQWADSSTPRPLGSASNAQPVNPDPEHLELGLFGGIELSGTDEIESVFISNPDVCDYVLTADNKLTLIGRSTGTAQINISYAFSEKPARQLNVFVKSWDSMGVQKQEMLDLIQQRVSVLFPDTPMKISILDNKIYIKCRADSKKESEELIVVARRVVQSLIRSMAKSSPYWSKKEFQIIPQIKFPGSMTYVTAEPGSEFSGNYSSAQTTRSSAPILPPPVENLSRARKSEPDFNLNGPVGHDSAGAL